MRVTQNSLIEPYQRALQEIQSKRTSEQLKISSGNDLLNLSDDPKRMVEAKQIKTIINRNEFYVKNIDSALTEMQGIDDQVNNISTNYAKLRDLAIDGATIGNMSDVKTLGVYVRGILNDLVRDGNYDIDGKYIFSGTKTTDDSITPTLPATNSEPFELIQGTATADNPSGLSVVYKGNFEDRTINKDAKTTEVINVKANQLFGENGTEMFDAVVNLYNVLNYDENGKVRTDDSVLTTKDTERINQAQKKLADYNVQLNNTSSQNGSRINRLNLIREQIVSENTRLEDYRSNLEDTNVARTSLELMKSENALKYTLQIGAKLFDQSLFDFLG